jgi:glutathione peroxidase-family protein
MEPGGSRRMEPSPSRWARYHKGRRSRNRARRAPLWRELSGRRQGFGEGIAAASSLNGRRPSDTPRWNFHKYPVGRDSNIAAVFATAIERTDSRVIAAIEKELAGA